MKPTIGDLYFGILLRESPGFALLRSIPRLGRAKARCTLCQHGNRRGDVDAARKRRVGEIRFQLAAPADADRASLEQNHGMLRRPVSPDMANTRAVEDGGIFVTHDAVVGKGGE